MRHDAYILQNPKQLLNLFYLDNNFCQPALHSMPQKYKSSEIREEILDCYFSRFTCK